jgi:hypothetical protein
MRQRPVVNCSSDESEYAELETNDDAQWGTDLTEVDTGSDEDDENDDRCGSLDDEALLFVNKDHSPEYYNVG